MTRSVPEWTWLLPHPSSPLPSELSLLSALSVLLCFFLTCSEVPILQISPTSTEAHRQFPLKYSFQQKIKFNTFIVCLSCHVTNSNWVHYRCKQIQAHFSEHTQLFEGKYNSIFLLSHKHCKIGFKVLDVNESLTSLNQFTIEVITNVVVFY